MCIFAVASTIDSYQRALTHELWIASKCVSLQWQAQWNSKDSAALARCELLQNVYLCSGKHNSAVSRSALLLVVNCFKMCIFAVASTIQPKMVSGFRKLWIASKCVSLQWQAQWAAGVLYWFICCELLQNVYLCSGKHNFQAASRTIGLVVNCFKMCIFAVASTIWRGWRPAIRRLWIASKCVSLQWQAQSNSIRLYSFSSCELLQNVYLCSGKHNTECQD